MAGVIRPFRRSGAAADAADAADAAAYQSRGMDTRGTRQGRDAVWMAVALEVGRRSLCDRDRSGAVVVSYDNRIVSTGYSGPPAGFEHQGAPCRVWCARAQSVPGGSGSRGECPSLHAEAHALLSGDRREREGGTLYVTSDVCFACARLVAASGVDRLVFAPTPITEPQEATGYVFLRRCGIDIVHWKQGV